MTTPLERVLIIIPTFNEAESLPVTVRGILAHAPEVDILVVDDGSPDGTGEIADSLSWENPQIEVMHRAEKAGLGAAYIAGFIWALERDYTVICEMDADGSHRPQDLPKVLSGLIDNPKIAMTIGSRWVPGGDVENWPKHREFLSRGGNTYVQMALGLPLKDATAGFRAYRRATLEQMDLSGVQSHGYCFQVDMSRRVIDAGGEVLEVPIVFVERTLGTSKMSGNIVREALVRVTWWGVQRRITQLKKLFRKSSY